MGTQRQCQPCITARRYPRTASSECFALLDRPGGYHVSYSPTAPLGTACVVISITHSFSHSQHICRISRRQTTLVLVKLCMAPRYLGMLVRLGRGDFGGRAPCLWHLVDELAESLCRLDRGTCARSRQGLWGLFGWKLRRSGAELGEVVYEWCGAVRVETFQSSSCSGW